MSHQSSECRLMLFIYPIERLILPFLAMSVKHTEFSSCLLGLRTRMVTYTRNEDRSLSFHRGSHPSRHHVRTFRDQSPVPSLGAATRRTFPITKKNTLAL